VSHDALDGIFLARPEEIGPGIRLAVKDLFDTEGLVTTYGSAIFAGHVPSSTATAVRLLEEAGYANVGKTNLHEFAYGTSSENPHFGTVPNPIAPGRIAGGSSGGSAAALAAGLADVALGTDTGGSIRIPAACCGIAGIKPTHGLVSLEGCYPLAPSFDHAGPMARSVARLAEAMVVLAPGFRPRTLESLEDVQAALAWTEDADPLVGARVEAAAAHFPRLRRIELPAPDGVEPAFQREIADVHRELFAEQGELYGENVARKIERALAVTDSQYDAALRAVAAYRERADELLDGIDILVTPTLPVVPPATPTDEENLRFTLIRFTSPFNVLGRPAAALPCGQAEENLPASVQLVGRRGEDALVLAAASLLETALN
jgi:aspartyl-tRNA(Asn)/glutamyl-tRNA(Gln) amidotransferase subunit A